MGPFAQQDIKHLGMHISKFGIIPKKHNPGEWRLIIDLSSPEKWSVNDGIDPALCSLSYTRVEQVAQAVLELHGTRGIVGQDRHQECIQSHSCPPR